MINQIVLLIASASSGDFDNGDLPLTISFDMCQFLSESNWGYHESPVKQKVSSAPKAVENQGVTTEEGLGVAWLGGLFISSLLLRLVHVFMIRDDSQLLIVIGECQ